MNGIYVRLVHTGTVNTTLPLTDIYPTTDGHTAFRRAGPVYLSPGGVINLTYTGEVAASFESGSIRGFVDLGYITAEIQGLVPPGTISMFGGAAAPLGYLLCDGALVSRTTYALLFAAIGTTWGAGDGSTTFGLPDLRGRGPVGAGAGVGLTPRALAATGGAETVTLDTTQIPSHTHAGTTDSAGSHAHTSNATGGQGNYGLALADGNNTATGVDASLGELNVWTTPGALTINAAGDHTHTFTSGATGGGLAHPNMQPFAAVNFMIKT
jgi:microcystin-dependent protein